MIAGITASRIAYTGNVVTLASTTTTTINNDPTNDTAGTFNMPVTVNENDVLIAFIASAETGTNVAVTSWTERADINTSVDGNGMNISVWSRTASASEPSTYNFTFGGALARVFVVRLTGATETGLLIETTATQTGIFSANDTYFPDVLPTMPGAGGRVFDFVGLNAPGTTKTISYFGLQDSTLINGGTDTAANISSWMAWRLEDLGYNNHGDDYSHTSTGSGTSAWSHVRIGVEAS